MHAVLWEHIENVEEDHGESAQGKDESHFNVLLLVLIVGIQIVSAYMHQDSRYRANRPEND